MRFSWKICLSTVLISLVLFSAGGYILINTLFKSTYDGEIKNALEENYMLQNSLAAYWVTATTGIAPDDENVQKIVQSLVNGMSDNNVRIRVSNERKEVYFDNTEIKTDRELLDRAEIDIRAYKIQETKSGVYELMVASAVEIGDELLYLESIRDVSPIFEERDEQYSIYRSWLLGVLIVETVFCYLAALWHLRQLHNLAKAAERISDGDLAVRAKITSKDELGKVADTFNHMADNLEHQFQEIEGYARRQEDFIGSFAHELKTPLTSIIGYADMICTRDLKEEERFQAANYIYKEGKRLEALSLKLLDLMVVRNEELALKSVYIKWLAEEIEGVLKPSLLQNGITLKVMVEDACIMIDPDLMKTVLLNLIDNGRKAIEGNGTIYLSGRKEEKGYALYVRDTGKGIPQEELSRITEAFYMVDKSRSRKQGGAGLGLAICVEIIKRHNGTLEFKSVENKGTIARIYLPIGDVK